MRDFFYLRVNMTEKILILDFGSQYTQLIARAVREANVYCEIIPYHKTVEFDASLKGIILSGSPFSVNDKDAPIVDISAIHGKLPVLGICYGAQLTAKLFGGSVEKSNKREYGRALLHIYLLPREFSTRGIIEAKFPEPSGGCNLERRRMRRAID